jgi:hypothetical protein
MAAVGSRFLAPARYYIDARTGEKERIEKVKDDVVMIVRAGSAHY